MIKIINNLFTLLLSRLIEKFGQGFLDLRGSSALVTPISAEHYSRGRPGMWHMYGSSVSIGPTSTSTLDSIFGDHFKLAWVHPYSIYPTYSCRAIHHDLGMLVTTTFFCTDIHHETITANVRLEQARKRPDACHGMAPVTARLFKKSGQYKLDVLHSSGRNIFNNPNFKYSLNNLWLTLY